MHQMPLGISEFELSHFALKGDHVSRSGPRWGGVEGSST